MSYKMPEGISEEEKREILAKLLDEQIKAIEERIRRAEIALIEYVKNYFKIV